MLMQRARYNPVTELPILVPCEPGAEDGYANFVKHGFRTPVRAIKDDDLNTKLGRQKMLNCLAVRDRKFFVGLSDLKTAFKKQDRALLWEAYEKLARKIILNARSGGIIPRVGPGGPMTKWFAAVLSGDLTSPTFYLPQLLSGALSVIRLVLWWDEKHSRFLPALFAPDLGAAVFAKFLLRLRGSFRICPRPGCGTIFVAHKGDQTHCKPACGARHRIERFRERERERKAKKRRRRASADSTPPQNPPRHSKLHRHLAE
jgi:CGNR zinc finger